MYLSYPTAPLTQQQPTNHPIQPTKPINRNAGRVLWPESQTLTSMLRNQLSPTVKWILTASIYTVGFYTRDQPHPNSAFDSAVMHLLTHY